jgi:hypothetical protein
MSISFLFIIIFLLLSFWLIPKLNFVKQSNLSSRQVQLLLAFKICISIFAAFYFTQLSTNVDYLDNNEGGKFHYNLLWNNPLLFFTDFNNDIQTYGFGGLFKAENSFWAYLRFNLLHKFIAILDVFTRGNFYFNTVIFSTIVFFGHLAFYRLFSEIYKGRKLLILMVSFLLPSLLLYTSCIHKDGIVFLCLGIISYLFHGFLVPQRRASFKRYFLFLLALLAIFLFRNYVVIAILPAMLCAFIYKIVVQKRHLVIPITYAIYFLLFFLTSFTHSFLNIPAAVVDRKNDFATLLGGNTNIAMNDLQPNFWSFVANFPQAINHSLFRPYLWEFPQLSVLLTAFELFIYQLLVITFVLFRKKQTDSIHHFNIFGLAFFFNMMLIIGYTIPNIGAIVRYRSIFWIYLIVPVICNIDWKRLNFSQKNKAL